MDLVVMISLMLVMDIPVKGDSDTQVQGASGYSGQGTSFFLMQHVFKLEGKVETQLKQIEEEIEDLKSKAINTNGPQEDSGMREDISEMKSDIENLSKEFESAKSELRDTNSALKKEITVLQDRISELQMAVSRTQSPGTTSVCPKSWTPFGESFYKIYTEKKTWGSARLKCRYEGGYLVEIDNEAESKFITKEAMYLQDDLWLGGSDIMREGDWRWVTSKKKISGGSFTDWNPGQPTNDGGNEHCLHIHRGFQYRWNDIPCASKYGYVCERESA